MKQITITSQIGGLLTKTEKIKKKGWIPSVAKGSGSVGRTFEDALGLRENYFEISDYEGVVEIKTKLIREDNKYKYINLFGATPDKYLFEIKRVLRTYGYPSRKDKNLRVFNLSFSADKTIYTRKYLFRLAVDRDKKEVVLKVFDPYTSQLIDSNVSWSFDMLEEKLKRKFKYLLYIKAEKKFEHNQLFFHYVDSRFYALKNFESFLRAIEKGYVRVTFKISTYFEGVKYGRINDHGTSFDIHEDHLEDVFELLKHN